MPKPDLLFLAHRIPFPPNKGDKIRAHALLSNLAEGYRVHLACFVDDPEDMKHRATVQDIAGGDCLFVPLARQGALVRAAGAALCNRSLSEGYFHDRRIQAWLRRQIQQGHGEQAVIFGSAMAPYALSAPGLDLSRSVLDLVDIDSDKWAQYARSSSIPKSWLFALEARRLQRLEVRAAENFGHTVLVSPHEAADFLRLAPHLADKIRSVVNGVDLAYFDSARQTASPFPAGQQAVVMTGMMDYWPNFQGAEWFAEKVLPAISLTGAHFYAVGANPPKGFLQGLPNVTVTGRVADIRPYLAHAAVVVAPLLMARGVQNKVLEAMAMARPVVATTAASRALAVVPGRDLRVADTPQAFVSALAHLRSGEEAHALGREARRFVERNHRWPDLMADFSRLLASGGRQAQSVSALRHHQVVAV